VRSRHYGHAPIAEAIIDIRCQTDATLDALQGVVTEPGYSPERSMNVEQRMGVTSEGVTGETTSTQIGWLFRREDGRRVVHARVDGLGFSWLEPYESWEKFVTEAESHWLDYRVCAKPTQVVRLGVRYVNRIDVPASSVEIKDYLRLGVDVPAYLPQAVSGYFMQVTVPLPSFGCAATITSALLSPNDENTTSLLLDVDTWLASEIDLSEGAEAPGVEAYLGTLRHAKNYVFESCITDATRGLIS
jgi:uncharacterized protein (TIGR04255 family)